MAKGTLYTRDGLIYVITDGLGHFKVGISTCKSVLTRLAELQVGNAFRLRLVHTRTFPNGHRELIEETAHDSLSSCRVRGEWFRSDQQRVISAVDDAVTRITSMSDEAVDEAMNDLMIVMRSMKKNQAQRRTFSVPDDD